MNFTLGRSSFAVALLFGTTSFAAEFKANDLFVTSTSTNQVFEFDPAGNLVRKINTSTLNCPDPTGLAFGPTGTLFVASRTGKRIVEIGSDGSKVKEIALDPATSQPEQITFGPDGYLYVGFGAFKGYEIRRTDGQQVKLVQNAASTFTNAIGVALDGSVWTMGQGTGTLLNWDNTGSSPRQYLLTFQGDTASGGIAIDSRGRLNIVFNDSVRRYDGFVSSLGQFGSSALLNFDENGITYGPDGNPFIAGGVSAVVYRFDANDVKTNDIGAGQGINFASHVAFAPYRFAATVKGPFSTDGDQTKLNEKTAVLTYFPGNGRNFLTFTDSVANSQDFASLFAAKDVAFAGFERSTSSKVRSYVGSQIPYGSGTLGTASIALEVKGKVDPATGFFAVTSAKGDIHRGSGTGVFHATVKTTKRL